MIENTNDEQAMRRFMLDALFTDRPGSGDAVLAQEARGQAQLVQSESLPTDTGRDTDAPFIMLGFTFGEPDPADPLFRTATLPEGWSKRATDHSMWSEIMDELGRVRAMIFYKAAYYDRRAFMRIEDLDGYVYRIVHKNEALILDDTWATRDGVMAALVNYRDTEQRYADNTGNDPGYIGEARQNVERAQALIESLA